jgi:hypothetical protein
VNALGGLIRQAGQHVGGPSLWIVRSPLVQWEHRLAPGEIIVAIEAATSAKRRIAAPSLQRGATPVGSLKRS